MPLYEHIFLARQDLAAAQVEVLTETFSRIIADGNGAVASNEYWGLRSLAYRIAKNRKAHYVMLNIDAPAPAIAEMERQVALNEDIIRYMTVRIDALPTEPSAMTKRGDRSDSPRGDRDGFRDGPRPDRGDRSDRPRGDRPDRDGPRAPRAF